MCTFAVIPGNGIGLRTGTGAAFAGRAAVLGGPELAQAERSGIASRQATSSGRMRRVPLAMDKMGSGGCSKDGGDKEHERNRQQHGHAAAEQEAFRL